MKKYLSFLFFGLAAITTAIFAAHGTLFHSNESFLSMALVMPGVTDITRARAAYDRVKNIARMLQKFGYGNLIVNEDFFRSEVVLSTATQYSFTTWQKTMDSDRSSFPLQQGVSDKDLFIGISAGLFIDNRASASAQVKLQSYPSYSVFNTNTSNLNSLYAIYNGIITLTVDRTVYIPRISTSDFLKVPQTQKSGSTNENQFSIEDSLNTFDPYFMFSGQNTNQLLLNVYNTDATFNPSGTNSTQNVATFYAKGLTIQSGAAFIDAFADFDRWAANEAASNPSSPVAQYPRAARG